MHSVARYRILVHLLLVYVRTPLPCRVVVPHNHGTSCLVNSLDSASHWRSHRCRNSHCCYTTIVPLTAAGRQIAAVVVAGTAVVWMMAATC